LKKTQILIVGQGLAGSTLAWELMSHSIDFLVMDSPFLPKSSMVAGGLYNPMASQKPKKERRTDLLWPIMKSTYQAMEAELGVKLLHVIPSAKLIPLAEVATWEEASKGDLAKILQLHIAGFQLNGIKPGGAVAIIGKSGYVDVAAMILGIKRILQNKNLFIADEVDYTRIQLRPDGVIINGEVEAKQLVFSEGAAGLNNPWFGMFGLTPNKGEILEITAPGLTDEYVIRGGVFLLPLGEGRFRVGATYNHNSVNNLPSEEGRQELLTKLNKIMDAPFEVTGHLAGLRPAVRDRQPILGFHPQHEQLAIFNGMGSKGVVLAPYWAKQMRKCLTEPDFVLPNEVSVTRFLKRLEDY
jgi:glycine/D-amino acid oxidase-like deaminating enzyme